VGLAGRAAPERTRRAKLTMSVSSGFDVRSQGKRNGRWAVRISNSGPKATSPIWRTGHVQTVDKAFRTPARPHFVRCSHSDVDTFNPNLDRANSRPHRCADICTSNRQVSPPHAVRLVPLEYCVKEIRRRPGGVSDEQLRQDFFDAAETPGFDR
jgi:hypothetical protein